MTCAKSFESPAPPLRTVRVALAGCGVVGGSLVRLLESNSGAIAARHGVKVDLARILVRDVHRERDVRIDRALFTNDRASFLAEDVDVVVEAIGGEDAAGDIARTALRRGRRLVTANKELIARSGTELAALALASSSALDFGAAVGGSAPVISLLRDLLGAVTPRSVRGILNGTSNFVLTEIERGATYDDALSAARQRGLAEWDCSRDLDGRDAAAKLAIVAWMSFGIPSASLPVWRRGISPDASRLAREATRLGGRLRLIAECVAHHCPTVSAAVDALIVAADGAFGRTELEDNRVEVDLGWAAPLSVSGPGAGGPPTAVALLADVLAAGAPANERDDLARFVPIDDPRTHRWLAPLDCNESAARRLFTDAGGQVLGAWEVRGHTVVIGTATRQEESEIVRGAKALGLSPLVARIDDGL